MIWISMALYFYWSIVPGGDIFSIINAIHDKPSLISLYLILILQIFYPLFGWIADAWIGRYRAILIGLYLLIIGCVLLTAYTITKYFDHFISYFFLYTSIAITSLGIAAVNANILPFITDQMIGASADELSTTVHWWYWSQNFPSMIVYTEVCILQKDPSQTLTSIFLSFSGLAIALSSLFLCQHWLDKTPRITNPIKHIAKVINYARKNKYPRNRSALTYWEQDIPSRLDLGKDKYGGPFSEEEVEDVKTTLRLIPVIFICAMIGIAIHVRTFQQNHMTVTGSTLRCSFKDELGFFLLTGTLGIPLYHFIIRPLLHKITKYTPSMLKIIGIALFLKMIGIIGMVTIETIGHLQSSHVTCMFNDTINEVMSLNYYWTIIPQVLQAFGGIFIILFSFKFIIAQSPYEMKGFLFGLFYAFNGIAKVFGYNLYHFFSYFLNPFL